MSDEQRIRDLIATWLRASAEGDINKILPLMAEDVVFLIPGQPPMRGREAFAASFAGWQGKFSLETDCEIQEIQVFGDWSYCWIQLSVTMTPPVERKRRCRVSARFLPCGGYFGQSGGDG